MKILNIPLVMLLFFLLAPLINADELSVSPMALKYYNEAMTDYKNHQYTSALLHFRLVIEMFPDYTKAHYYLGNCYSNLNRVKDAIREYRITYKLSDGKGPMGIYSRMALLDFGKSAEVVGGNQKLLRSSLTYSSGEGVTNHYDPYLVPDHVSRLQAMKAIGQEANSQMEINKQNMEYAALAADQTARWANQGILTQAAMTQVASYGSGAFGTNVGMGGYLGGMGGYYGGGGYTGMGGMGYGGGGSGGYGSSSAQLGIFSQLQMMQNYDNAANQIRNQRRAYDARNQAIKEDVNGLRTQFKRGPLYDGVQLSPAGTDLYTQYFGSKATPRKLAADSGDDEEDY